MKASYIIIIILCIFIGFALNSPNESEQKIITSEKIKEFENEIVIKNNDYGSDIYTIDENIFNKAGKGIEKIIDKSFGFFFGYVKSFIND